MWVGRGVSSDTGVRLELLDDASLSGDPFPDLPLRLQLWGRYAEPVDGVELAHLEVRFDPGVLLDLGNQIRAVQLARATAARRAAEETAAAPAPKPMSDIELLQRVLTGLARKL